MDVSAIPAVQQDDESVLLGWQNGVEITAEETGSLVDRDHCVALTVASVRVLESTLSPAEPMAGTDSTFKMQLRRAVRWEARVLIRAEKPASAS